MNICLRFNKTVGVKDALERSGLAMDGHKWFLAEKFVLFYTA